MKKIIIALSLILSLSACGKPLDVDNKHYPTYGLFNKEYSKSDDVCYQVSVGNIVWSIILIETIFAPVYFIGFSMYNPVGLKDSKGECKNFNK